MESVEVPVEIEGITGTSVKKQETTNSEIEIENLRDKRRQEILTSIAEKGLLPARKVAETLVPSTSEDRLDFERTSMVSGTLIFSEKQKLQIEETSSVAHYLEGKPTQIRLRMVYGGRNITTYLPMGEKDVDNGLIDNALYKGDSSVFPVVCERGYERKYETAEQLPTVLEERVQNSILVVAEMDKIPTFSSKGNEIYLPELPPDKMKILVPQAFYEEARQVFEPRGVPVTPVPLAEKQIYKGRNQNGVAGGVEVNLPDFETELKRMVSNSEGPLFIHGVRLPTKEDIEITRPIL